MFRNQTNYKNLWQAIALTDRSCMASSVKTCCRLTARGTDWQTAVLVDPSRRRNFLLCSRTRNQESLWVWILFSRISYSTPGRLSNLGFAISSLPACTNSKFPIWRRALIVGFLSWKRHRKSCCSITGWTNCGSRASNVCMRLFPKNYTFVRYFFVSIAKCRNVVKWYFGS